MQRKLKINVLLWLCFFCSVPNFAQATVDVYLLAGQSNMLGHGQSEMGRGGIIGELGSLRHLVNSNPGKYGALVDSSGQWVERDDVMIWSTSGARGLSTKFGPLTIGYAFMDAGFGPEFAFGHLMGNVSENPVLLIKTAWGGRTLGHDYLPPSAEDYPTPLVSGDKGFRYKDMLTRYRDVVNNIENYFPQLANQPLNLKGFVWFQGYNDRFVSSFASNYESNLVHLINDLRRDLNAPDLPVVVGETGVRGLSETHPGALQVRRAQSEVANFNKYPEFEGNVKFVPTIEFWRSLPVSPVDDYLHWHGNAYSYYSIGESLAQAMLELVPDDVPDDQTNSQKIRTPEQIKTLFMMQRSLRERMLAD